MAQYNHHLEFLAWMNMAILICIFGILTTPEITYPDYTILGTGTLLILAISMASGNLVMLLRE